MPSLLKSLTQSNSLQTVSYSNESLENNEWRCEILFFPSSSQFQALPLSQARVLKLQSPWAAQRGDLRIVYQGCWRLLLLGEFAAFRQDKTELAPLLAQDYEIVGSVDCLIGHTAGFLSI